MKEKICYFHADGHCTILCEKNKKEGVKPCSGKEEECSFYKTADQFHEARDHSIDRCREKGYCGCMSATGRWTGCKYGHSCQKRDEIETTSN